MEIEAFADQHNGSGLKLRWIFRAGERLLTDDEIAVVTQREGWR